jgi:integrase
MNATQATYGVSEVAGMLGSTPGTIRAYVRRGALLTCPRLTSNGKLRIPSSEVERLTGGNGMGARYDEKRGQWVSDFWYHHPDGRRERFRLDAPVNTREGALEYETKARSEIAAGTFRRAESLTLARFSPQFFTWIEVNRTESYLYSVKEAFKNHLLPWFGKRVLSAINNESIEQFKLAKIKEGLAPKTINNFIGNLSKCLSLAVEYGRLQHKPRTRLLPMRPVQDQPYRALTQGEVDAILKHASPRLHSMILLAVNTGLRMGEIQGLHWDDIDKQARLLTVKRSVWEQKEKAPKNNRSRTIPLNEGAMQAIQDAPPRRLGCPSVYYSRNGKIVRKSAMYISLGLACDKAGVKPFGWHVFRHTFASWLSERSKSLRVVQKILGHSTIAMTERYSHPSEASLVEAVKTLDIDQGNPTGKATVGQ